MTDFFKFLSLKSEHHVIVNPSKLDSKAANAAAIMHYTGMLAKSKKKQPKRTSIIMLISEKKKLTKRAMHQMFWK